MITERQQVNRKYWDQNEQAYVVRRDDNTRRFIWWLRPSTERPMWVIQEMDNDGNQIGEADYAANKRCLSTKETT